MNPDATLKTPICNPIVVYANLNVGAWAYDRNGDQIPALQKSLATLLAEHIEKCGFNPEGLILDTQWGRRWQLVRNHDGTWNHRAVPCFYP